jgi:hypothetical protein
LRGNANFTISVSLVRSARYHPPQRSAVNSGLLKRQTRFLILVAQAMLVLPADLDTRPRIEAWFAAHIEWMLSSPQGHTAGNLDNKMSRWYHAAVSCQS